MKKARITSILISLAVLLVLPNSVFAQTEYDKYEIKHVKTYKQKYSADYYSYNFALYPTDKIIDSIKIAVISDMETKYTIIDSDISPPHWISLGIMIHAKDPDSIRYEVVKIITK